MRKVSLLQEQTDHIVNINSALAGSLYLVKIKLLPIQLPVIRKYFIQARIHRSVARPGQDWGHTCSDQLQLEAAGPHPHHPGC